MRLIEIVKILLCHTRLKILPTVSGFIRQDRKTKYYVRVALLSFACGWMFFVLAPKSAHLPFMLCFLFLSFMVAPILGIIASIISFKKKAFIGKLFLVFLIFLLLVVFFLHGRYFVISVAPYIYTPSAITRENLSAYKECIKFVKDHDTFKAIGLKRQGFLSIDGTNFITETLPNYKDIIGAAFSGNEIIRSKNLAKQLARISSPKFRRCDDTVVFYKSANSFLPMAGRDLCHIFPAGQGVVYSLAGENPNEIDNEILNAAKPFIQISGNWYMSRNLILAGPRSDIPTSTPKSLIDHSLKIDGIDPNELHKFD